MTLRSVKVTLTKWPYPGVRSQAPRGWRTCAVRSATRTRTPWPSWSPGPGVYICNECVDLCNLIIAEKPSSEFRAWTEQPDDELLTGLAKVQAVVSQADAAVHDYVDVLRGRGISWTRIGAALGVSKQAAWERFSGED